MLKIILVQGFCPLTIKITQFPDGVRLVGSEMCIRDSLMGARENKCQISQNDILRMKFSEFYLCFHISCEIYRHIFSQAPMRNCHWCYYR